MSVTVWRATLDEKPAIGAVVKRCGKFVRDYSGIRGLDDYYRAGMVLAAEVDGVDGIAGFCVVRHNKRNAWSTIYEIGTVPEARGRGVGRALITFAVRSSRWRKLRLVVDAENTGAREFYARLGFDAIGRRHNKRGDTIIDMELTL